MSQLSAVQSAAIASCKPAETVSDSARQRVTACSMASRTSSRLRAWMSVFVPAMRNARPAASRSTTCPRMWIQRHSPLAERTRNSSEKPWAFPFIACTEAARTRSRSSGCVSAISAPSVVCASPASPPRIAAQRSLKYSTPVRRSVSQIATPEASSASCRRSSDWRSAASACWRSPMSWNTAISYWGVPPASRATDSVTRAHSVLPSARR